MKDAQIEKIFFEILEIQCDEKEGGALAGHYFQWLSTQADLKNLYSYINWINKNFERMNSPSVLRYLIQYMIYPIDTKYKTNLNEIENIWNTINLYIKNNLDHPNTGFAINYFMESLQNYYNNNIINQTLLNRIAIEFFRTIEKNISHFRVINLMISFVPFWGKLVESPKIQDIIKLWIELLYSKFNNRKRFNKLTRQINDYLTENNDLKTLQIQFYDELYDFINKNIANFNSPAFLWLLIMNNYKIFESRYILRDFIIYQENLEITSYCLGEYLRNLSNDISLKEKLLFETSLLDTMNRNTNKPFMNLLIMRFLNDCQNQLSIEEVTNLLGKYSKHSKSQKEFYELLCSYKSFQNRIGLDNTETKRILEYFLLVLKNNYSKKLMPSILADVLSVWEIQEIPKDVYLSVLLELLHRRSSADWEQLLYCCKRASKHFGEDSILISETSIGKAVEILQHNKENGMLLIKDIIEEKLKSKSISKP